MKLLFIFENTNSDFNGFLAWIQQFVRKHDMEMAIVGMEPNGHYWLNLAHFLKEKDIKLVVVNPMHVKKS